MSWKRRKKFNFAHFNVTCLVKVEVEGIEFMHDEDEKGMKLKGEIRKDFGVTSNGSQRNNFRRNFFKEK